MCYSAMLEASIPKLERVFGARFDGAALDAFRGLQQQERDLGPEAVKASLGLKRTPKSAVFKWALDEPLCRVYPGWFAPAIVAERGERKIVPMRYRIRPADSAEEIPSKFNVFNARCDSLTKRPTWKKVLGRQHALLPFCGFFEWVDRHGKPSEVMFRPSGYDLMWAPALFDEWVSPDGQFRFRSLAIITDEPPPEVLAAGHDRCPIFLSEDTIEDWLQPQGASIEQVMALLKRVQPAVFEHQFC